jgi:hypothetical protein
VTEIPSQGSLEVGGGPLAFDQQNCVPGGAVGAFAGQLLEGREGAPGGAAHQSQRQHRGANREASLGTIVDDGRQNRNRSGRGRTNGAKRVDGSQTNGQDRIAGRFDQWLHSDRGVVRGRFERQRGRDTDSRIGIIEQVDQRGKIGSGRADLFQSQRGGVSDHRVWIGKSRPQDVRTASAREGGRG